MWEEYAKLISNVGFPIFISLFLLIRIEKVIKSNTQALNELKMQIKKN